MAGLQHESEPGAAAENRQCIIDAAGALFGAKGFAGICRRHTGARYAWRLLRPLADSSKGRSRCTGKPAGVARSAAKWERIAAGSPKGAYAALLANDLTPTHRDDPARGCAFASLGSEAARGGKAVHGAFADGLRAR